MTDQQALLAAILANPDEDMPRLVYADWLQDHDYVYHPMLIRKTIETGKTYVAECFPFDPTAWRWTHHGENYGDLEEVTPRLGDLRHRHDDAYSWLPSPVVGMRLTVRRGFVEEIRCTASQWLQTADQWTWREGDTEPCGHCVGREPGTPRAYTMNHPCRKCWGKRDFPRPIPTTAHPIHTVTITELDYSPDSMKLYGRDGNGNWKSERWPGIGFKIHNQVSTISYPLRIQLIEDTAIHGRCYVGIRESQVERGVILERVPPLDVVIRDGVPSAPGWRRVIGHQVDSTIPLSGQFSPIR